MDPMSSLTPRQQLLLKIMRPKIVTPFRWLDARRVKRAIEGYPVYSPPHRRIDGKQRKILAQENFEYFMEQKPRRLDSLGNFLAKFNVKIGYDDRDLLNFATWAHQYAGHLLVPTGQTPIEAYDDNQGTWTDEHRGLNVVWDVGSYIGECILARRSTAFWALDKGDGNPRSREVRGYLRPCISGVGQFIRVDVMEYAMDHVLNRRRALYWGAKKAGSDEGPFSLEQNIAMWASADREPEKTY